jgi:hypothetical protein
MESLGSADPFYELSTVCVRNVHDAFWGLGQDSPMVRTVETQPGDAMTISWPGPSIASLITMNAPESLNSFDVDDILKHLSLQLQSGSFPSHTGRVVGNLPNGGFVSLQQSLITVGIQSPICFFVSKPCFISSNMYGVALISVPHDSITALLPPGTNIVPLTFCIIARKISGALEFHACAEQGFAPETANRPNLDKLHNMFLPLALLLDNVEASCSTNTAFIREVARAGQHQGRLRSQIMHPVINIVVPYLTLQSKMKLLAVCRQCRKLVLEHFCQASSCDAVSTRIAPSRLNHLLRMHEQLCNLALNVGENGYTFEHLLRCTPTLVNLTTLQLHNLQAMADANMAHVLRSCKQLRIVELRDAAHAGALSLLAVSSSCRFLRRLHISSAHTSIVNDLLTRELTSTCFASPLQSLELPMCSRYGLTSIRHIVTNFGGSLFSKLDLSGCMQLGDAGISSIVTLCARLETFIARFSPASDASCQALSKCSNLVSLDLSGSLPSRKGLFALAPLAPSLRRLLLSRCTVVNDANLCELLRLLPIIEYIEIRGCPCISYSTILLLEKLAPHAEIGHSIDHRAALQNVAQVMSFIRPMSERAEASR